MGRGNVLFFTNVLGVPVVAELVCANKLYLYIPSKNFV